MKKGNFKIFVALILCFSIILSSIPAVFAKSVTQTYTYNGVTYSIDITENKGIKTIKVSGGNESSLITLDTKTNKAHIKIADKTSIETDVDLSIKKSNPLPTIQADSIKSSLNSSYTSTLISSKYTTWWGYYYQIYKRSTGDYWWAINNGVSSKLPDESASNSGELYGFKDAVDSCASNQVIATSMVGAGVASAIAGAIAGAETLGVATVIGLLIALGASIGAAGYFYAAWVAASDADFHYERIAY